MPAVVTHYLFALRVFSRLKKSGLDDFDRDMALIGAQGPDIFFFHRVLPWKPGDSQTIVGRKLHRGSPARLFEGFRSVLNTERLQYKEVMGYVVGFFCHYALDRAAHPYIYWAQEKLSEDDPDYGTKPIQYHFRIESALDTMILRRETGRLISSFHLMSALPRDSGGRYRMVGRLYNDLLFRLYGMRIPVELLALAPGDMRHALFFLNDRGMLRQRLLFRPIEKLVRKGHFASSLMRPQDTSDWDYANEAHKEWSNPYDSLQKSTDSFYRLYDDAVAEAADMITEFVAALPMGKSMQEITQDRGFSSDLPGVYDEV
ncbi:MAG TPA: hypothetical protein DEP23_06260 [Ruminococcaceae bacterium]|nr:hypothetical protein [Oscillospiraceae bacterium]